jgi:hypothetical protein
MCPFFGSKKAPREGPKFQIGIDKSEKMCYHKGVGATDDGASLLKAER